MRKDARNEIEIGIEIVIVVGDLGAVTGGGHVAEIEAGVIAAETGTEIVTGIETETGIGSGTEIKTETGVGDLPAGKNTQAVAGGLVVAIAQRTEEIKAKKKTEMKKERARIRMKNQAAKEVTKMAMERKTILPFKMGLIVIKVRHLASKLKM